MIHFLLLSACGPGFTFDGFIYEAEYDTHIPIVDGLTSPTLLTTFDDAVYLVEEVDESTTLIHEVNEAGLQNSLEVAYTPLELVGGTDLLSVTERGIEDVLNDSVIHQVTDATHVFELNDTLYWTVERVAGTEIHNGSESVFIELYSLDDILIHNDQIYAIDQQYSALVWIDTSMDLVDWVAEEAVAFDDDVRRLTIYNEELFVTTRSTRWPYGGWILRLIGSEADWSVEQISESPPEAEHILVHNDTVVWL